MVFQVEREGIHGIIYLARRNPALTIEEELRRNRVPFRFQEDVDLPTAASGHPLFFLYCSRYRIKALKYICDFYPGVYDSRDHLLVVGVGMGPELELLKSRLEWMIESSGSTIQKTDNFDGERDEVAYRCKKALAWEMELHGWDMKQKYDLRQTQNFVRNLETRVSMAVYAVMEERVTTHHDSPALGIATHYVDGKEFQYFPSQKTAEEFVQRQQEERLSKDKDLHQDEVHYSIKKYEFDIKELPTNLDQLLQTPKQQLLEPRTERSSGSYR